MLKRGQRIKIFRKPTKSTKRPLQPRGECVITSVNVKDRTITTDGLPKGTKVGDLIVLADDL